MTNIRACPFCNDDIVYDSRKTSVGSVETKCHCLGCGMQFTYSQDFALSNKARVPINTSFEELWNRRSYNG